VPTTHRCTSIIGQGRRRLSSCCMGERQQRAAVDPSDTAGAPRLHGGRIDGRYHGERQGRVPTSTTYVNHLSRLSVQTVAPVRVRRVWDVMRLIDYLETRDDVDTTRIGLMANQRAAWRRILAAAN